MGEYRRKAIIEEYGVNGKLRGKILVARDLDRTEIEALALEEVKSYVENGYKKIIYIPGRIFNIVV